MSMLLPGGPCFGFEVDNLADTPDAQAAGTAFTFGASNADGTAVQVLDDLAQDVHYVIVGLAGATVSTEDSSALVDLLVDPAGGSSWADLISNLCAGFTGPLGNTVPISVWYHFPLFIKAGSSLAVQGRRNGASTSQGSAVVYCFGKPKNPEMWWCGQKVESLGINESTSKGTAHTPGSSGAFSAFAAIGTPTARTRAVQLGLNGSDAAMTALGYNWELGVGGAKLPGTPRLHHTNNNVERSCHAGLVMPIWCDIAAGTDIQVRANCSGVAEAHNVAIYAVQ